MRRTTVASALLFAAWLTGCAPQPPITQIEYVTQAIPTSMLQCLPEPVVPPEPVTDRDIARWIVALRDAGDDCRGALQAVRDYTRGQEPTQ